MEKNRTNRGEKMTPRTVITDKITQNVQNKRFANAQVSSRVRFLM